VLARTPSTKITPLDWIYHAAPTTLKPIQRAMPTDAHACGDVSSRNFPTCLLEELDQRCIPSWRQFISSCNRKIDVIRWIVRHRRWITYLHILDTVSQPIAHVSGFSLGCFAAFRWSITDKVRLLLLSWRTFPFDSSCSMPSCRNERRQISLQDERRVSNGGVRFESFVERYWFGVNEDGSW